MRTSGYLLHALLRFSFFSVRFRFHRGPKHNSSTNATLTGTLTDASGADVVGVQVLAQLHASRTSRAFADVRK